MRTQAEDLAGGQGADAAQLGEVVEATLTVEILGRVVRPNAESVAVDSLGLRPTGDPHRGADHRFSQGMRAA